MKTNVIYNTDFLLNDLEDESIDLIVTDPPYKCISGGRPNKKNQPSGILHKNDGKIFKYNDIKPEQWFCELYRVLKDNSHCYVMVNTINLENYLRISREVGFKLHNLLVWKKNNSTPNRWYMKNGEYVLFLRKGKAKPINNVGNKTIHEFDNIRNKLHPTEKPIKLMQLYIENSSKEGDIVLDPFSGSGSVLKACKITNRQYIGYEIDKEYFDVITKSLI